MIGYGKRDLYGRIAGNVMVALPDAYPYASDTHPKTLDTSLAQITVGLAWWYQKYSGGQSVEDRNRYESAETQARAKKTGLWVDNEPVPSWKWRKRERK